MTQWDFQNKGTLTSPARLSFVFEVPLRHLRPSVIYSVPCDRILQRAHYLSSKKSNLNNTYIPLNQNPILSLCSNPSISLRSMMLLNYMFSLLFISGQIDCYYSHVSVNISNLHPLLIRGGDNN